MTDREAIKHLKDVQENIKPTSNSFDLLTDEAIETVLNYIEELEEKNSKLLDEQTATYMNDKELQESVNRLVNKNFIPKQVILDKIEELEQQCKNELLTTWLESQIEVLQEILKGENNEK